MNSSKSVRKPLQLISPLHRANRQTAIYLEEQLTDLGVSAPEAHIVSYVDAYGPCPIGELVRVFGYKKPTMTSMLDRLERKELIRRELNPKDRRSFVVSTVEKGPALAEEARGRVEKLDRTIRRRVSEDDFRGFLNVVDAVAETTGVNVREDATGESPSQRR
jgi:DNA-binding MarR family transcriptional regulator